MNKLMALLILLTSLQAFGNCKTYEALVFGDVVQTIKLDETCLIELDIDQISEHRLCPLARVDIELSRIIDKKCTHTLGQAFDGVIIQTPGKKYLEFDR